MRQSRMTSPLSSLKSPSRANSSVCALAKFARRKRSRQRQRGFMAGGINGARSEIKPLSSGHEADAVVVGGSVGGGAGVEIVRCGDTTARDDHASANVGPGATGVGFGF